MIGEREVLILSSQVRMKRKMLDLKLEDKIPRSENRKRTKMNDIVEYRLK